MTAQQAAQDAAAALRAAPKASLRLMLMRRNSGAVIGYKKRLAAQFVDGARPWQPASSSPDNTSRSLITIGSATYDLGASPWYSCCPKSGACGNTVFGPQRMGTSAWSMKATSANDRCLGRRHHSAHQQCRRAIAYPHDRCH